MGNRYILFSNKENIQRLAACEESSVLIIHSSSNIFFLFLYNPTLLDQCLFFYLPTSLTDFLLNVFWIIAEMLAIAIRENMGKFNKEKVIIYNPTAGNNLE